MKICATPGTARKESILEAAIHVFSHFGYKKASMDDVAEAAGISKQGLYLHFSGKEELFLAANRKYLDDGLRLVDDALSQEKTGLFERICNAIDAWFGRHFETFAPKVLDIIETGRRLSQNDIDKYKKAFCSRIAKALQTSTEFSRSKNIGSPDEVAEVLFTCGLSWKETHQSRAAFMKKMATCAKVCCQIED